MPRALITRSDYPIFMQPGRLQAMEGKYFDQLNVVESMRDKYFKVDSTEDPFYIAQGLTGIQSIRRKPEGEAIRYDKPGLGRTFTMVFPVYALGVAITKEAQDDDKTNKLVPNIVKELKRAAEETAEEFAANLFSDGFALQGWESDGSPLFSTSHSILKPGVDGVLTTSNRHATNAALSITSLDAAYTALRMTKNDTGRWMPEMTPKYLDVHPSMLPYALQIVRTARVLGSNNNDTNLYYGQLEVRANPRLKLPNAWFLSCENHSWVWMNREKLSLTTDVDFGSDVSLMKVRTRYGYGAVDWRGKFGSAGA